MKHLLAFCLLFVATNAQAQLPALKDFRADIKTLKEWANNLHNENYYGKNFKFKNKETGETKLFKDFSAFQKAMFYMMISEKLSRKMAALSNTWASLKDMLENGNEMNEDSPPGKKDIDSLLDDLQKIRKIVAEKWELVSEKTYKDYADKFDDKEKEVYIKQMRSFNDSHGLIERKK